MYGLGGDVLEQARDRIAELPSRLSEVVREYDHYLEDRGVDLRGIAGYDLEKYDRFNGADIHDDE